MSEERDRLQAMVDDTKGTTWDHSPNDIKAIKWALERIDSADDLSRRMDRLRLIETQIGAARAKLTEVLSLVVDYLPSAEGKVREAIGILDGKISVPEYYEMRNALEAVLLFHSPSPWDGTKHARWTEITGIYECTSKNLCDHIRKILGGKDEGASA